MSNESVKLEGEAKIKAFSSTNYQNQVFIKYHFQNPRLFRTFSKFQEFSGPVVNPVLIYRNSLMLTM